VPQTESRKNCKKHPRDVLPEACNCTDKGLQAHKEALQLHRDKPPTKLRRNKFKSLKTMFFDFNKFISSYVFVLTSLS